MGREFEHGAVAFFELQGGRGEALDIRAVPPDGRLTAELVRPDEGGVPTIVLIEQTPAAIALYEIGYRDGSGPALFVRFEREIVPGGTFTEAPRP